MYEAAFRKVVSIGTQVLRPMVFSLLIVPFNSFAISPENLRPLSVTCKAYSGNLYHDFAEATELRISETELKLSVGDVATSSRVWIFDNRISDSIFEEINEFTVHGLENGIILGYGIRIQTSYAFQYVPFKAPDDKNLFTITTVYEGATDTIEFSCL